MDELVSDLLRNNLQQIKRAVREKEHERLGEPSPPDPIPEGAPKMGPKSDSKAGSRNGSK